ncbi:MAG: ATP synthase F1 subunit gamma [Bacteroidaceae bacterium]|nr:ATP synthase F1 subunit gamma [Bacteroidaceae bacterium]
MASLKEVKSRIASVRNTLQITSAMKMVSAAKLHHAQQAIQGMHPYEEKLHAILNDLLANGAQTLEAGTFFGSRKHTEDGLEIDETPIQQRVAIVVFSSNSSLCGGFNANVIKYFKKVIEGLNNEGVTNNDIEVYAIGKKIAAAARKQGFEQEKDYAHLAEHPNYEEASALGKKLMNEYVEGRITKVILLYNHYASNSNQPTLQETWLPLDSSDALFVNATSAAPVDDAEQLIVEPSSEELIRELLPKVLLQKIYTVLLDANAAEHAARTVAMQIASDNAEKLLDELTLEYNKTRQQKITAEILDLVGGLQR